MYNIDLTRKHGQAVIINGVFVYKKWSSVAVLEMHSIQAHTQLNLKEVKIQLKVQNIRMKVINH